MEQHIHGGDITHYDHCIDYSTNINPLGTPESVKAAARDSLDNLTVYPQPDERTLRHKIAEKEGFAPSQVVCGNGATGILFSLARALRPKETLLTAPAFAEYERAVRVVDSRVRFFMRHEEEGFALTRDYLDELTEHVDLAFLCNPNNPDGTLIEEGLLMDILERSSQKSIRLVMDECFLDMVPGGEKRSLTPLLAKYKNVFVLKAFTKTYGLAGLRLGYGLTRDKELLSLLADQFIPWQISGPAQAAGIAALSEDAFLEQGRQIVQEQKKVLYALLEEMGYKYYPSEANYILFEAPLSLFQDCARRGILLRDCSNFKGLKPGYYRIAVKSAQDNEKLISVFREVAAKGR